MTAYPTPMPSLTGDVWRGPYRPVPQTGGATIGAAVLPPARQGWECPRCRAILAPHVDRCTCNGLHGLPIQDGTHVHVNVGGVISP